MIKMINICHKNIQIFIWLTYLEVMSFYIMIAFFSIT
jgi:hypothetical protein